MKMSNIMWGCNLYTIDTESPIIPNPYLQYPKNMPNTNNIGVYGILYRLLTYLRKVPASIPKIRNNITKGPL